MESVCTQNVPGVRIPPSPPQLGILAIAKGLVISAQTSDSSGLTPNVSYSGLTPISGISPVRDSVLFDGRRSQRLRPRARPADQTGRRSSLSRHGRPIQRSRLLAFLRRPPQPGRRGGSDPGHLPDPVPEDRDLRRVEEVLLLVLPRRPQLGVHPRPPAQVRRRDRLARRLPAALGGDGEAASPEFTAWVDGTENETIARDLARRGRGLHRRAAPRLPGRDLDGGRRGNEAGRRRRDAQDLARRR